MDRFLQRRRRLGILLLAALGVVLAAGSMTACSDDDSPAGPGPVGPVGPVGPGGEDDGITGSGTITTEPRDVSGFDRIVFRSEGRVIVTVGTDDSLVVEVDDNLQPLLRASVSGGELEISTSEGTDIDPSTPPVFRVGMAAIAGVDLAGAGTIEISSIESERLEITLSGVGDVTIGTVDLDELVVNLSGVGTVSVSGVADRQEARVGGVTIYEAENLESRTATIDGAGTGQATIWVTEELEITAADTASVSYYGTPTVTQDITSLATAKALGDK
jgi:hypothetical protein